MIVYTREKIEQLLKIDFIRFGLVGAVGFVVSEAFLFILSGNLGLAKWLSLLIGNEAGLLTTFIFHQTWTYKHANHGGKSIWEKLGHFHLSCWSGVAIIFIVSLLSVHVLNLSVYIGQALGSAVAMFWNFFWTKYFIFKGKTPEVLQHPENIELEEAA